jgi:uncharacterized protein
MPMIRETIVTTVDVSGRVHIAPLGLIADGDRWIIAPFRPSTTLDNLRAVPFAVANYTDDVRVFAGCLTGRRDWPLAKIDGFAVPRLQIALTHAEFAVDHIDEHEQRPRFICRILRRVQHAPFEGLNRAKAAVLELAVLASRLNFLPREKIEAEMSYLKIAIDKTAGPDELEAWGWLTEKVNEHYAKVG